MKKLLYSLGTFTTIVPISAVISCGNQKESESEQKSTPTPASKKEKQSITDDTKSKIKKAIIKSSKSKEDLLNISSEENKTWKDVEKTFGISSTNDFDSALNESGIKIDFSKPKEYSGAQHEANIAENITIKKEGTSSVKETIYLESFTTSTIELSKIRDTIYYGDEAPSNLKSVNQDKVVTLNQLGLDKSLILNFHASLHYQTNITFKVKSKLSNNQITLTANVKYGTSDVKSKDITITYDYLTFEGYEKITNGIVDNMFKNW